MQDIVFWVDSFCFVKTWTISIHSLPACRVSEEKSAVSLIRDPVRVFWHFPSVHFRIFYVLLWAVLYYTVP